MDFCQDCHSPEFWLVVRTTQVVVLILLAWVAYRIVRRYRR